MNEPIIPMTEAEVRDSQGKLIRCPKCKDMRWFTARSLEVDVCREC